MPYGSACCDFFLDSCVRRNDEGVPKLMEWISILLSVVLVNNYVLVKFLGLCPFLGVSQKPPAAIGMGFATVFVLTISSALCFALYDYVLAPLNLQFLNILMFILSIASVVGFCEMYMRKSSPVLHQMLGQYLPLITSNCAVLGVALITVRVADSVVQAAWYGFAAALGFGLTLYLFSMLRQRLQAASVPAPFQGSPIALITAGFMAVGFMGFSGIV